ncbi:MAG: glycosyltransferase family 2 protein [Armatimonadota bacterium]|nr:glycosyltransferase family 2 protein [Armatimonadota bacterium]
MQGPPPDVSVCIVSWNVADDLRACLKSIRGQHTPPTFEIIVADNASSDESVAMLREHFPEVKVIVNERNLGFARACNQTLRAARGRYLLVLNPDTVLEPDALEKLVAVADAHPQAGIVAPKLVYPDGSLQHSCRRFPTITAAVFRNTLLGRVFPNATAASRYIMADRDHDTEQEVDWASGACLLIRREAYEEVGELDEGFVWGSEDVDYCLRMHQAGWTVLYSPVTTVVHAVGRSSDQAVIRTILRTHRGMFRLYSKHFARNPLAKALVFLGVWLRGGLLVASWCVRWLVVRLTAPVRRLWRRWR